MLDGNLRYSLGKTAVNKEIKSELSRVSSIKWFHEKNNGLVFTCNDCQEKTDSIRVIAPQVVNGGQTLHTIASVAEDLQAIPPEARTEDENELLKGLKEDLKLSVKLVVTSGGRAHHADKIALASNTQNPLSERTMKSSSIFMRDLRLKLARLKAPWFVVTKDGEWDALSKNLNLFKSKTGNRRPTEFKRHRRYAVRTIPILVLRCSLGLDS